MTPNHRRAAIMTAALIAATSIVVPAQEPPDDRQGFRFKSAVELVNVTATVTDRSGRFVSGLHKEDFRLFEDNTPQTITHFSSERVPVSLGIVLDTSGSMAGEKIVAAKRAIDRFINELLDPADEIFIYTFDQRPELVQEWTTDRELLRSAVDRVRPRGGTALYDAVAEAVPLANTGRHRKKAVVIISDGNDTSSQTDPGSVKAAIRETEVLVYAIGVDGRGTPTFTSGGQAWPPFPIPFPRPGGGRRPGGGWPMPPQRRPVMTSGADGLNAGALRDITDDTGGRTEIIRDFDDLQPATASIADELSKQYLLGYVPPREKDGRWHTIKLEVEGRGYQVRARRGYLAN
jgi:Ca-activated chloride channel family protein